MIQHETDRPAAPALVKLLVDTNIFINYVFASRDPENTVVRVVELCLKESVELIVPGNLLLELRRVSDREHVRSKVSSDEVETLLATLRQVGTIVDMDGVVIERVTDDPKDDFFIAAARLTDADVLISGDKDLIRIRDNVFDFLIVTPGEFLKLMRIESPTTSNLPT